MTRFDDDSTAGRTGVTAIDPGTGPGAGGRTVRPPRRRGSPRPGPARRWWPFALPAFVLVAGFFVVPFVLNIRFAFTDWSGYSDAITANGLDNFRTLADQDLLWNAIRATLIYAVIAMLVQNVFSLSAALLLQRRTRVNGFFRSLFFIPVLIAPVAAGYIWSAILAPSGPLNKAIGIVKPGFEYAWLGHSGSALASVAFIDAWKWSGLITLVYIAGLNAIPASLIEAATLDGANGWKRFWKIRFPLLAPAFTFTVVVTLLGALNAFDIAMATTHGGPGTATTVLNVAMFNQYASGFFGTSSALSLIVTILVLVIGVPLIFFLRRREIEG
ncbi:carbohydrate ABC transporter permease [Amycolatopsis tolypomycina]|uniref:Carbohydrate ABC transporter membrane protein 1, CUT1 family n=1 Tax=Amycolatopsis tolypomycina TaxID=208445 RepID=A0A1H4Y6R1_9PSEU|nr:sugar ABC transporter permease [Amycolatopsis tolypomycina]SED12768.1 carbohydrate ABC transporter membrane protein 1, CUT1 family [Amycolatopsis tolypomycina]